jgi:hypothetical protein
MNGSIVDKNWKEFKRRLKGLWGKLFGANDNLPAAARH